MELNNKMLVKVAFFLFLMGFSATAEASRRRLDPNFIIRQVLNKNAAALMKNYYSPAATKSTGDDDDENKCCRACACTLTWPHRVCFCGDTYKESCPASCENCVCEETEEYGKLCYCEVSTEDDCYIPSCRY